MGVFSCVTAARKFECAFCDLAAEQAFEVRGCFPILNALTDRTAESVEHFRRECRCFTHGARARDG